MSNATYQSAFPITAKIVKEPTSEWEIKHGYVEVMIEGPRLSFSNLWKPGTYSGEAKKSLDADIILPTTDETAAARKVILQAANTAAKAGGTEIGKIKGKQRKIKVVKLGALRLDDDGEPELDDDGNPRKQYNDGHMVISASNSFKKPPLYVSTAGKIVTPKKVDEPKDGYDIFEMPVDPNGMEAQELVGTGNNVRVKVSFRAGVDTWNGNKPKVWAGIVAVQFLAEDEKLSKGGAGGDGVGDAGDGFSAVAPPAGDGFDTDEVPHEKAAKSDDDGLFNDDELDMFTD